MFDICFATPRASHLPPDFSRYFLFCVSHFFRFIWLLFEFTHPNFFCKTHFCRVRGRDRHEPGWEDCLPVLPAGPCLRGEESEGVGEEAYRLYTRSPPARLPPTLVDRTPNASQLRPGNSHTFSGGRGVWVTVTGEESTTSGGGVAALPGVSPAGA